jgi:hypothetical protein
MAFRVGQKVICVNAVNTNTLWLAELVEGEIYTVTWTNGPDVLVDRTLLDGHPFYKRGRFPFYASRFRPIVSRKTDISALKALLVPGTKILEDV